MVNGIHQSSEYIRRFWMHAVKYLHVASITPHRKILFLGVAGGTIIHILSEIFPTAVMTGVDIDSVMIEMGKKYFGLSRIRNISFVAADAKVYVQRQRRIFDLIVIDIYVARDLPDFLRDKKFLENIRLRLAPRGYVLMNYLRDGEYTKKAEDLEKKFKRIFNEVQHVDYLNNCFFLARK